MQRQVINQTGGDCYSQALQRESCYVVALKGYNVYARRSRFSGYAILFAERDGSQFQILLPRWFALNWRVKLDFSRSDQPVRLSNGRVALLSPLLQREATPDIGHLPKKSKLAMIVSTCAIVLAIAILLFLNLIAVAEPIEHHVPSPSVTNSNCDVGREFANAGEPTAQQMTILGGIARYSNFEACGEIFDLELRLVGKDWALKKFTPVEDRGE